jgi:hypothetical protein
MSLNVVLAAVAVIWGVILTVGHANAADNEPMPFTFISNQQAAMKRAEARDALREKREVSVSQAELDSRNIAHARAVQVEFERLCKFKPVMSDAEINGCKQAFKL